MADEGRILGDREPIASEDRILERVDHGTAGLYFMLITASALPQDEHPLSLSSAPTRGELARAIGDYPPKHVAYELARKAPNEWVASDPPLGIS
jgi:hypothetical protein